MKDHTITNFGSFYKSCLPPRRLAKDLKSYFLLVVLFCCSGIGFAQNKEINGTIKDANNVPVVGVNVIVQNTTNGTQSDFDGNYSITAAPGDVLVFSFIGFKNQERIVGTDDTINVVMEEDLASLDEVVITGYGKQSRAKLTTSVAKMDTRILETSTRSNAATALQGTIPGLRVTNTTGQPGSTPDIVLRGGTSFDGSGSPLILIDGVPGSFYALNSDDIESIEVLKDAAATAIYGARAANGVVLVTTKSGEGGKTTITYKQKYSINYERETPDYLDAANFIKYNRQAVLYYNEATGRNNFDAGFLNGALAFGTGGNTTNSPFTTQYLTNENRYLLDYPGWNTVTDPVDPSKEILFRQNNVGKDIYQPSTSTEHYIGFQGGNEKGSYYASLGYLDNDGLILGSGFKRYSGKFTGSYNISETFKVNSNILYSHSNLNLSPLGNNNTVFRRFAGQAPTSRTYNNNPDGSISDDLNPGTNFGFGNPLYYQDKFIRDNLEQRLTASVGIDWDLMSNLTFSLTGSHFTVNNLNENFNKAYLNGNSLIETRNASASTEKTLRNQITGTLNYTKTFDKHYFDLLLGAEYYRDEYFSFSAGTKNSPTDLIPTLNAGAEANGVPYSYRTLQVIASGFGRLNYDYDDRYLLGLTFRYDGSSRLGNNKYGFFPGLSVGWNLHNENFFQDSSINNVFTKIKPRISYGVNGNLASLALPGQPERTANFVSFGSYGSQGVYDGQTGYANTRLPTLDLRWERSTTLNFGLDMSLFDNRINLIADYFIRDVEDKISDLTLPYWTGFGSIRTNNGILRNKGFELQLGADIVRGEGFQWSVNGTLSKIKNFVVELPENDNELNRQGGTQIYNPSTGELEYVGGLQEGKRVGNDMVVTYVQDYIYANQAEVDADSNVQDDFLPDPFKRYPGDVAWVDTNGDDIINSFDRQVIGRTTPDFYGGLSTNMSYKNFSLYVKTDFATGHVIYNHIRGKGLAQTQGNLNQDALVLDSWTPQNTDTDVPRFVFVDAQDNIFRGGEGTVNSRFWEKGDYLAIRELTLSYDLPTETFTDKIKKLSLYVTGTNLHYFKSYSGDTPEQGGYQAGQFPLPRTFTLGLNLTL
ncbi:TonB-linked outer membrane protein, SusC/RagA family [Salegentibacter echinorum]|uniref:TonB-linked outer membrane protein, SusC/RagA family n=1 Tax=Salegentibacter echinorum TaxID=1073325 RepID=A0A1M5HY36_SALEC|nr:TonB-dependent receptor [Salegentibacter echinorum]SHG20760.1 TonB-linked outer membrane protein, SusC/RagA family [Salegentibacter echinorum]